MSNIARRTRSHVSIDDHVLNDNLDFPDVDQNLYQNPNSVSDPEYKDFLYQCYSEAVEQSTDTNTEDNDPAYVYNDDIFSHGWKFNLDEEPLQQQHQEDDRFGPEFARVLNQQLRQHIQLLTQTCLLAKSMKQMEEKADEAKEHLNSYMKIFKDRCKPSNLLPAIQLVNDFGTPKELKCSVRLSWRPLPVPETVKTIIDQNPNVFPYVDLLPQVAFSRLPENLSKHLATKKHKIIFTLNEDKLLALALNEFKGESSPHAYIASLLLAPKTKLQIGNHIKNIKRSLGNEDNPIKLYYSCGKVPHVDLDSDNRLRGRNHQHDERQMIARESVSKNDSDIVAATPEAGMEACREPAPAPTPAPATMSMNNSELVLSTMDNSELALGTMDNDDCEMAIEPMSVDDCSLARETMNMDDLMAASTTISKHNNNYISERSIKSLRLKKSMMDLMSHKFFISEEMGDLIVHEFLKSSQEKLTERNYIHLLQLLTELMRKEAKKDDNSTETSTKIYNDISKFLKKIEAPVELHERLVLFLNLDAATKCNCALSYLHWMRFFQFIQHVKIYHETEGVEKKLSRLIDALQKDDPQKIKTATASLINKHPLLKREYEALALNGKPHSSLFICDEDFDDQTEPFSLYDSRQEDCMQYEHFEPKLTSEEMNYASQSCPCKCHQDPVHQQQQQHCGKCNLKFMKGRMYLVNKIKPCLAEWTYIDRLPDPPTPPSAQIIQQIDEQPEPPPLSLPLPLHLEPAPPAMSLAVDHNSDIGGGEGSSHGEEDTVGVKWTFEEDKEILEFCRVKAEQNDESVSFDTKTFEELVIRRSAMHRGPEYQKSAHQISERFNQLMELYKRDE